MISLTLAMVRARLVQTLTIFLLAAVAVGAAVAAPVYIRAAEERIVAADVAASSAAQRSITATDEVQLKADPDDLVGQSRLAESSARRFEDTAPSLMATTGFASAFSARYNAFISTRPFQLLDLGNGYVEYRQDYCGHVVIVAGRCVSGPGEVLVTQARADAGLGVSSTVVTTPVQLIVGTSEPDFYIALDEPSSLVVVGVYRPSDPTDAYWGQGQASGEFSRPGREPVLMDRLTLAATAHPRETQSLVVYAPASTAGGAGQRGTAGGAGQRGTSGGAGQRGTAGAGQGGTFALERLDRVREDVGRTLAAMVAVRTVSEVDTLLLRIEQDRRTVRLVPGVAALPLVALCWFVLYLAIAHTAQARRAELGMVKLRGVSARDQWWIVAGEGIGPVVVGGGAGYLVGHVGVWAYARVALGPDVTVALTGQPLPYAAAALAGALVAGVAALRRDLVCGAADLLRGVPARRGRWQGFTLAVLVSGLAVVSVIQMRGADDQGGLARLAPALSIIALGLLGAVVVDPVAGWLGVRALRRGRIGLALAALHLGRRRSGSRLLAPVVVAVALLTFAAAASQLAQDARLRQAGLVVGADRVLTVSVDSPSALLDAVRQVDPRGDFAMAVVPIFTGSDSRALLAVDSPRLARVAIWPRGDGDLTVAAAAAALRPAVADPVIVRGTGLTVTATVSVDGTPTSLAVDFAVTIATLEGTQRVRYPLQRQAGTNTYQTGVACAEGCRLVDLRLTTTLQFLPIEPIEVTVESVRQTGPDADLASPADLGGWLNRSLGGLLTEPTQAGLRMQIVTFGPTGLIVAPPDTPADLAMLDAGGTNILTLEIAGGQRVTTADVTAVPSLPRLGENGAFTDLEYLLRVGDLIVIGLGPNYQVWLGPQAPPDIGQRLAAAGVTVTAEQRLADEVASSATRPSAIGVRFLLIVAVLGLLLGAAGLVVAAGVERRSRAEEIRALRVQGLARSAALRAAMLGYVALVGVACVLGVLAAAGVWYATGEFLPIIDEHGPGLTVARTLGWQAIAGWAVGSGVIVGVATVLAIVLASTTNRLGPARNERTSR